jgi:OmpA-OmpF porin, OOP family
MNAKRVVAAGFVAAMLALGPAIASAQEGPYFSLFLGKGMIDISQSELNDFAANDVVVNGGGTVPTGSSDLNDMDTMWGVQVGYRFNRFVAAEVGYVDLGKANYVANLRSDFGAGPESFGYRARFLVQGPTVAVLGIIPIGDRFDVYGRGGILFADTRFRTTVVFDNGSGSFEAKAGTQEFFGGGGFSWNINEDYAVKAEASYFLDAGDDDRTGEASVAMLTLGITFR